MSLNLTDEEISLVAKQQRPGSKLPTFFDPNLQRTVPISREFEAFLIVYGKKIRAPTLKWLEKSANSKTSSEDRDALLKEVASYELIEAKERYDEILEQVGEFEKFKAAFTDSRFDDVPEVGLLLTNIQAGMNELMVRRDRTTHQTVMANLVNAMVTRQNNVDNDKQRESWVAALNSY